MLFENEVAFIHGAARAAGSALARTFAREGAQVFLSGRTLDRVKALRS